jgi:ABC-type antimicrobial peptide transport system permease subunit
MLCILYIKVLLSFDKFLEKQSRIYRITSEIIHHGDGWEDYKSGSTGGVQGPEFKHNIAEVEDYCRVKDATFIVRDGAELVKEPALYVDASFLSMFSFPLISGNPKTALSQPRSLLLTPGKAMKFFGTTDVVGRSLELGVEGTFASYPITGIIKEAPGNSSIQPGFVVSMDPYNPEESNGWVMFYQNTFVTLHPLADPAAVEAKFAKVFEEQSRQELAEASKAWGFLGDISFGLQPLADIHLQPELGVDGGLTGGREPLYIYILAAIAAFILLIACINFVNLAVAQSLKRSKEVGIRKVVGSMRSQLIKQFLGESFLVCLISFTLAILITWMCIPGFNRLADKNMSLSYLIDGRLLLGYFLLFFITTIAAGFYPALVYSGFQPVRVLYGEQKLSSKNYFAKGLIVIQFSLSAILIISTAAVYSQFNFIANKDLGFNEKDLIRVDFQWWLHENAQIMHQFRDQLSNQSSIVSVGARNGGRSGTMVMVGGGKKVGTDVGRVDNDYFATMQIPIIAGRNFSHEFPSDTITGAIVNEAFVRAAGWKDPIGQEIDFYAAGKKRIVVGVVKDFHFRSLKEEIAPHVFTQDGSMNLGYLLVRIKPDDVPATVAMLKNIYRELIPKHPFEYHFVDLMVTRQYEQEARWKNVIEYAAMISVFISCMGLFGLTTLIIRQRTREIAIRKVLGAPVPAIIGELSGGFIRLTLLAFLLAVPAGHYAADQWLDRFAYRVDIQWWVYVLVGIGSLLIAFATISFQSIRAARANPVDSLKH